MVLMTVQWFAVVSRCRERVMLRVLRMAGSCEDRCSFSSCFTRSVSALGLPQTVETVFMFILGTVGPDAILLVAITKSK